MSIQNEPTDPRNSFGDIAPALAERSDKVLIGEVWRRPGLSPRDRSLITVASRVALYRTNELPHHLKHAPNNGVTRYSGWPTAMSALTIARTAFDESGV